MPGQRTTARRYAEAAFELAERDGVTEAWLRELESAAADLSGDQVQRVLGNPATPYSTRAEVVDRVLGDRVSRGPRNLVLLLLRRGRIDRLGDVAREFRRLHHRREGIVEAIVTSAGALEERELTAIRERLAQLTGGRVDIEVAIDPSILGGVVVRLGDRLIDGSVRGRLERLRGRLAAGAL